MNPILIIGVDQPGHVGRFLYEAALSRGLSVELVDTSLAMGRRRYFQSLAWRAARYPLRIKKFGDLVLQRAEELRPHLIISTGLAPLTKRVLVNLRKSGVPAVNYSTDDPWNPAHRSHWFLAAAPYYSKIYSTRRSVFPDFQRLGVSHFQWLPFAISPDHHYPEGKHSPPTAPSSLSFVGGADRERVNILKPLIRAGIPIDLWGGYWERYKATRPFSRGMASMSDVRKILSNTTCALTLVRRANRDGHAMRSFEVAAMASPALAERTEEHLELLGEEGISALYFDTPSELVSKARWMLDNPLDCIRIGTQLHSRLALSGNTYADRLFTMICDF